MIRHTLAITWGLAAGALLVTAGGCAHKKPRPGEGELFTNGSKLGEDEEENGPCGGRIHFALDSADIATADLPKLERTARCIKQGVAAAVRIEGNADERGTEEYNLALGDRRARAVARYLSALGASQEQIQTVSYGEENPLCDEHGERCWEKNRRAAVRPTLKSLSKEDR